MNGSRLGWLAFFGLLLGLAAGGVWFLYQEDEIPVASPLEEISVDSAPVLGFAPPIEAEVPVGDFEPDSSAPFIWPAGAVPGELVMSFATRSDLEKFLEEARLNGLTDLEVIPALGLVRVRTKDEDEARRAWRLAGDADVSFNPIVDAPDVPPLEGFSGRYLPFGDQALAWMGVPDDNSSWGEGVRIAVLDTGVDMHPSLANASITHMSLLEAEARLAGVGTHGTSVASLLAGQGDVRGIAPGAEILSIQVLGADGSGSGFDLAMGIIEAVTAGANPINLSLGTPTDSPVLRAAVQYAQERGVILVASAGNDGAGSLLYPAGYSGVVAVASVDGNSQHVPFSNRGSNLSVAAPGYGLMAAGPDGSIVMLSGTSFSTPLVTGSLAYLLQTMPPAEAVQVLQGYANDGGPPGRDGYYGYGVVDMERVEWRNVPGIYDIAVADHFLDFSGAVPEMLITVQNRGTEAVGNIFLDVLVNDQLQRVSIGTLADGDSTAGRISLTDFLNSPDSIEVLSRVVVPDMTDVRPDNDIKGSRIQLNP